MAALPQLNTTFDSVLNADESILFGDASEMRSCFAVED